MGTYLDILFRFNKEIFLKLMKNLFFSIIAATTTFPLAANAEYYLAFSSYKQSNSGSNQRIANYTSPSVKFVLFENLEKCEAAGQVIMSNLYMPVKFFDGKYICVEK